MRPIGIALLLLAVMGSFTRSLADEILRLDFENGANLLEDTSGAGVVGAGAIGQSNFFGSITQSSDAQSGSGSASFNPNDFENGQFLVFDDAAFPNFGPTDSFSISYFVQPTAAFLADGQGFRGIVSTASDINFTTLDWQFDNGFTVDGGTGDGSTTFSRFNSDNFTASLVEEADLVAGVWTQVTLSYNAFNSSVALYVDGALRAVDNDSEGLSAESLIIGANRGGTRLFDGLIDDVRVFDEPIAVDGQGDLQTLGDLDFANAVTVDDYNEFRAGQGADFTGLTALQAYQLGDLDFDGDNDAADFATFKQAFEQANGAGSFAAIVAAVPEPGSGTLLLVAGLGMTRRRKWRALIAETRHPKQLLENRFNRRHRMLLHPMTRPLALACSLSAVLLATPRAQAIQFDFGDGSVDSNTGVAANFVLGENDPLAVVSQTIDGVTLTLTPVVADGADFGMSQWGANSQGIGVRSVDSGGSTSVDSGSTGGQRRRIAGSRNEAIHFSFDTDVVIDTLRLGSLAPSGTGDIEIAELSFVSGDDPFAGAGPLAISSDPAVSTSPTADLPVNTIVTAGTVLSLSTAPDNTVANGILFNEIAVSFLPLTLQVFTDTGEVRIVNESAVPFSIDYYSISSADAEEDGGSLNAAGWTGLAGAAGFPDGLDTGNGWDEGLNNDDEQIVESFLLGDSTIAPGDPAASLGNAFVPGSTEDLTFTYHIAGSGIEEVVGTVEYLTGGGVAGDADGDGNVTAADYAVLRDSLASAAEFSAWRANFGSQAALAANAVVAAVPEPSGLALVVILAFSAAQRKRPS